MRVARPWSLLSSGGAAQDIESPARCARPPRLPMLRAPSPEAERKERDVATTVPPSSRGTPGPNSWLDRYFKISERGSNVRTELVAGLATWLTMSYILFVNPSILGSIKDHAGTALPFDQVLTVTALVAGVMTLAMGLFANYPFALAAGLGLNAFVTFTLVATLGLTWREAMGVIVIEGLVITVRSEEHTSELQSQSN